MNAPRKSADQWFSWVLPAILAALAFCFRLSVPLALGLLGFISFCYILLELQAMLCPFPIGKSSLLLFVPAWTGQFIGHKIEGQKPFFFKDVVFLLIGPAWLMHFVHKKLRIEY